VHEELTIGPWKIAYDPVATRAVYQKIAKGGADECRCDGCRNFVAIRKHAYPPDVRALLTRLGIDVSKEAEVYEMGHDSAGHFYGGFLHFIGSVDESLPVIEGQQCGQFEYRGGMLTVPHPRPDVLFKLYFHNKPAVIEPAFKGLTVAQVELEAVLPWVLEEPEP
jgi:hypothetical protein